MRKKNLKKALVSDLRHPEFDILGDCKHSKYKTELLHAYNYANYTFQLSDLKGFANEYIEESLNSVPDYEFRNIGIVCWLSMNGADIPQNEAAIKKALRLLIKEYKKTVEDSAPYVVDIQTEKAGIIIAELEGILDDVYTGVKDLKNPLELYSCAGVFKHRLVEDHFKRTLKDIKNNPEDYTKNDKKIVVGLIGVFLSELDKHTKKKTEKAERKVVRKAKANKIIPTKMVAKLKYKKDDKDYKIKSVLPSKIVTADVLFVFNTKTRKILQFVSQDKVGLLVSGSTVKNYDIDLSQEKTLRKPEEFFMALNKAGKVEQRNIMKMVSGKSKPPKGRINEHCILLKVY